MISIEIKTRILPGGRIKIQHPELIEGREVTVKVILEDESSKRSFLENLEDYPGGQLFKTGAEVDQYIKEERDSWGD